MHLAHKKSIFRGLRYSGQLVRRARSAIASLRPATMDAVIISILCVIFLSSSTAMISHQDCFSSQWITKNGRSII